MNIEYPDFKKDCEEIFSPYLGEFRYTIDTVSSEEYTIFYKNNFNVIEVSMLSNFPHIGVSVDFLSLNLKRIRRSILNKQLNVDSKEEFDLHKEFTKNYDLNEYDNQMKFSLLILKKFYEPILNGDIKLDDLTQNHPA